MLYLKKYYSLLLIFLIICYQKIIPIYKEYNYQINLNQKDNYILQINKIDLNVAFSLDTTLNVGLEIHNISKSLNNPLIISGHSGYGSNVYFNDLDKLTIYDEIIINHKQVIQYYQVIDIKYVLKHQNITVSQNNDYLYLVTCDKFDSQKQLIIIAKKIQKW